MAADGPQAGAAAQAEGLAAPQPPFLSTLCASSRDREVARVVLGASAVVFLLALPFARVPLTPLAAFIPAYQAALIVNDLITAVLLFGQFRILRTEALWVLASAYLYSAGMTVLHSLSFPGLFSETGLLGAGPHTTAWLYAFWHGGFPLFLVVYASLKTRPGQGWVQRVEPGRAALVAVALVALWVAALGWLATTQVLTLPPILLNNHYTTTGRLAMAGTWSMSLPALWLLWRRRPHSVLDLWLMVVLCVWLFDIALAAVFNGGRFDLGYYVGRIYGWLAASFVLMVLLLENGALYAGLAASHEREVAKSADLHRLAAERESMNALLAQKNQQLAEASRLKSEFLASMSHELRTPLNAIIGFSEVLKDGLLGELAPDQHEYITDIYGSGQHLLALINDILDLSKIEAGKMTLDLSDQSVDRLLGDSLVVVRSAAAARGIGLAADLVDGSGLLQVDARKVRQILYNLLSNAVKFTPDGGSVSLRAARVPRSALAWEPDGVGPHAMAQVRMPVPANDFAFFLEISVSDTGVGIGPEDAPRLFHAFTQLDSSLARASDGTGLGLALVMRLAQLHGGTVGMRSAPGQGSCFTVWLPWREAGPGLPASDRASPLAASQAAESAAEQALIIEDNPKAAELIRLQLATAGLGAVLVATARQGLDLLEHWRPSVIILDILLPDMDGWDLLVQLKQGVSPTAQVPVIVVSIVADEARGLSLGASAVLQKPVSREDLYDALHDQRLALVGPSVKVLVVDDDPRSVELIAAYLSESGFTVRRAFDGQEGLALARRERPDMVVLDLMMPQVNGFEFIKCLKQDQQTCRIPILVVTARALSAEDLAELGGDVVAVLEKASFNHNRFVGMVRKALSDGRRGEP